MESGTPSRNTAWAMSEKNLPAGSFLVETALDSEEEQWQSA